MVNTCPVCGYLMRYPPAGYHICPSCGTEFGYDDAGRSHAELRAVWLRNGAQWWSPIDPMPSGWDPYMQLNNIVEVHSVWAVRYGIVTQHGASELSKLTGLKQGETPQSRQQAA